VKRLRTRQGLSAQRLAERCAELGHPEINRSVIANIESRRQDVSINEVMVLAAALNTPATLLIAPLGTSETKVAVTSKTVIHPHLVLDWLTGQEPLCNTNRTARVHPWRDEGAPSWQEASLPLWLFQRLRRYQDAAQEAERRGGERFDTALRNLAQHIKVMERADLQVPAMPAEWRERMAELSAEEEVD
jgi:transcriptional regulator with XRE-family HTH domain